MCSSDPSPSESIDTSSDENNRNGNGNNSTTADVVVDEQSSESSEASVMSVDCGSALASSTAAFSFQCNIVFWLEYIIGN